MTHTQSSFQSLGNGVYRVSGMQRSAVTGRFVSDAAARHPRTTVTEKQAGAPAGSTASR